MAKDMDHDAFVEQIALNPNECPPGTWCMWNVLWTWKGFRYLADFDTLEAANTMVMQLCEAGRKDVTLAGPQLLEIPNGVQQRLWDRIEQHIRGVDGETVARMRVMLSEARKSAYDANLYAAAIREAS